MTPKNDQPKPGPTLVQCLLATAVPLTPSVVRPCSRCAGLKDRVVELWVSRNILARVDSGRADPLCPTCVDEIREQAPSIRTALLPEQSETLLAHGALGWADQYVTEQNRKR